MKIKIFILVIFMPFTVFSQKFNLSNNLNKLVLDQTTIQQATQILGKPNQEDKVFVSNEDKFDYALKYDSLKIVLRFDKHTKMLLQIWINPSSPVMLNEKISPSKSDTASVMAVFGNPNNKIYNIEESFYYYPYNNLQTQLLSLFFEKGILTDIVIDSQKAMSKNAEIH